jgi:hypothetical protein
MMYHQKAKMPIICLSCAEHNTIDFNKRCCVQCNGKRYLWESPAPTKEQEEPVVADPKEPIVKRPKASSTRYPDKYGYSVSVRIPKTDKYGPEKQWKRKHRAEHVKSRRTKYGFDTPDVRGLDKIGRALPAVINSDLATMHGVIRLTKLESENAKRMFGHIECKQECACFRDMWETLHPDRATATLSERTSSCIRKCKKASKEQLFDDYYDYTSSVADNEHTIYGKGKSPSMTA